MGVGLKTNSFFIFINKFKGKVEFYIKNAYNITVTKKGVKFLER